MKYAKLINGYPSYAPNPIIYNDNYIGNPSIFVYEEKDPAKLAEIKAHNDALKPLDVVGRELMVGDTVAYALMGGYGKYNGMQVGTINSISKEMVNVDGKGVTGNRCCLISRKDGKRIE